MTPMLSAGGDAERPRLVGAVAGSLKAERGGAVKSVRVMVTRGALAG